MKKSSIAKSEYCFELSTETGQVIHHDIKLRKLRWMGYVAKSNPSRGSLNRTTNASVVVVRKQIDSSNEQSRKNWKAIANVQKWVVSIYTIYKKSQQKNKVQINQTILKNIYNYQRIISYDYKIRKNKFFSKKSRNNLV